MRARTNTTPDNRQFDPGRAHYSPARFDEAMRLKREGRPLTRTAFKLSYTVTSFYGCRLFGRSTGLDFPSHSFRKVDDVIVDQHRHSCAVVAVDDHLPALCYPDGSGGVFRRVGEEFTLGMRSIP